MTKITKPAQRPLASTQKGNPTGHHPQVDQKKSALPPRTQPKTQFKPQGPRQPTAPAPITDQAKFPGIDLKEFTDTKGNLKPEHKAAARAKIFAQVKSLKAAGKLADAASLAGQLVSLLDRSTPLPETDQSYCLEAYQLYSDWAKADTNPVAAQENTHKAYDMLGPQEGHLSRQLAKINAAMESGDLAKAQSLLTGTLTHIKGLNDYAPISSHFGKLVALAGIQLAKLMDTTKQFAEAEKQWVETRQFIQHQAQKNPADFVGLLKKVAGDYQAHLNLAAEQETDPLKRTYFEAKKDFLAGNIEAACLKLIELKEKAAASQDPDLIAMRQEACALLSSHTLAVLTLLERQNDQLLAQRMNNTEMLMRAEPTHRINAQRIAQLRQAVELGLADTLDEAMAQLATLGEKVHPQYEQKGVLATGLSIELSSRKDLPTPQQTEKIPTIALQGGTLKFAPQGGNGLPQEIKVEIGKAGGRLITPEGRVYDFKSSTQEKRTVRFLRGTLHVLPHKRQTDYVEFSSDYLKSSYADQDFSVLLNSHTKAGMDECVNLYGKQGQSIQLAKALRHRNGSYEIAGELLESVLGNAIDDAKKNIPEAERNKIKQETQAERSKVEAQVLAKLNADHREHPAAFEKRFPGGKVPGKAFKEMVDAGLKAREDARLDKAAYQWIDTQYQAGKLEIASVKEAWKIFEDMKDPLDKWFNFSDETLDRLTEEAVVTACTLPLSMGVGHAVRGSLMAGEWYTAMVSRGGWRMVAAKGAVHTLGAASETAASEFNPRTFMQVGHDMLGVSSQNRWKGEEQKRALAFNLLMSVAFHGGGGLTKAANRALHLDDAALAVLKAEGKSVVGRQVAAQGVNVVGQGSVAAGLGGLAPQDPENPQGFADRLLGSLARVAAMHGGALAFKGLVNASTPLINRGQAALASRLKPGQALPVPPKATPSAPEAPAVAPMAVPRFAKDNGKFTSRKKITLEPHRFEGKPGQFIMHPPSDRSDLKPLYYTVRKNPNGGKTFIMEARSREDQKHWVKYLIEGTADKPGNPKFQFISNKNGKFVLTRNLPNGGQENYEIGIRSLPHFPSASDPLPSF